MECELELEQQHLGALDLAGICREISRVLRQAILPNFANLHTLILPCLSSILLLAAFRATVAGDSDVDDGSSHLVVEWLTFFSFEITILLNMLRCTAAYVLCVVSFYSTGGDLLAVHRVLTEGPPVVPFRQLAVTFLVVVLPFFVFFSSLYVLAFFRLEIKIMLPLRLLGWASAAYVAVVGQLACVVSVLEDAALFSAVRRSRELLAGKFWTAACVLVTLDGCIVAVLKAFLALGPYDALGVERGFQLVAAWVVMFVVPVVALCSVLVVALVAQPVVYMVCKCHHQGLVEKAHREPSTATTKGVELQIETVQ